ncbi:MAG: hypothetical protein AUJ92_10940 [Armatimonadetes bacterium CG2_30_59_28]|nr:50S ribosomal protein 6 [Armatimonadota bacterium]OIO94108.1 MAG: hypothetical protein AUJ92_10940 [Armatimonadetes bacterium CG2_30_59_28]PIU67560.1 MAG: hypothetical protein COS85_00215 [Armatimonadetes bacterium CG07_land_8_20_14_0_80_59_28]PIY43061.1 MAG: hypothetical protein COZ05_12300 [Armatimonadetes bacterium CG_4_10_14_3_um_filter_59_10]
MWSATKSLRLTAAGTTSAILLLFFWHHYTPADSVSIEKQTTTPPSIAVFSGDSIATLSEIVPLLNGATAPKVLVNREFREWKIFCTKAEFRAKELENLLPAVTGLTFRRIGNVKFLAINEAGLSHLGQDEKLRLAGENELLLERDKTASRVVQAFDRVPYPPLSPLPEDWFTASSVLSADKMSIKERSFLKSYVSREPFSGGECDDMRLDVADFSFRRTIWLQLGYESGSYLWQLY